MTSYYPIIESPRCAPVSGVAAYAFTQFLPRQKVIERTVGLSLDQRRQVIAAWDAMNLAAAEWAALKAGKRSPSGSAEVEQMPVHGDSQGEQERSVPTEEAAARLQLSTRRVRQLLDAGTIRGYKAADRWFVHTDSLEDYELSRRAA